MTAGGLRAGRLALLRRMLRAASSPGECLPLLAEIIAIAEVIPVSRTVLSQALAYSRAVLAALPADGEDRVIALFLEAEASLLRGAVSGPLQDLDNAIVCLRRLRAMLPADDPGLPEISARLGGALLTRAAKTCTRVSDLEEAGELFGFVLDGLAPGDPRYHQIHLTLATQRAVRYSGFGGTEADREAAVAHAEASLAGDRPGERPGERTGSDEVNDSGHVILAWMALERQFTAVQRTVLSRQKEVDASRLDGAVATSLLAELGLAEISAADVDTTISHLRQVSATPSNEVLRDLVPVLWGIASLARLRTHGSVGDVDQAVDGLGRLLSGMSDDDPERGELLALRASILAARSATQPGGAPQPEEGWRVTTDALGDAVNQLPAGHPMRSAGFDLLQHGFGQQVAESDTAEDPAAGLEAILAAMERMPRDDPKFARLLATVGLQMLSVGGRHRSAMEQDRLILRLEEAAIRLGPDDPLWPLTECMRWGAILLKGELQQRPDIVDGAIAELMRCADSVPAGYAYRPLLLASVAFALIDRHAMGGELRDLARARQYVDRAFAAVDPAGPFADGTAGQGLLRYLRGHLEVIWCYYDAGAKRLAEAVNDLERAAELIDSGNPAFQGLLSTLEIARAMPELQNSAGERGIHLSVGARQAFDRVLAASKSVARDNPEYPVLVSQAASGLIMRGLVDNDLASIDRGIVMFADACAIDGLAVRERPRLLTGLGQALCTRYSRSRDPRDLSNAIDRLEEARRAVEQEIGSPYAADVLQTLASAYRLRADATAMNTHARVADGTRATIDVNRAVTTGLAGLREHAGDVLLQDTDEHALHVARRGTSDAIEMARWFLGHDLWSAAIDALELGRGMVLHAATSGAGVEEALRAAGQRGLADEWAHETLRGGAGQTAGMGDLRYRVMLALERSPAEARLLSAPSIGDIASALAKRGADALVYLLPRDDAGFGAAVVVDADETVRPVPLPGLYTGERSPVGAFDKARRALDAAVGEPAAAAARAAWLEILGSLCGWAWSAVIGPLLRSIPARGTERRIVLVPGGELGLVPWHAARRSGGDGWYACQEAVFSYAASARQFVDVSRRCPPPWPRDPVLVSDADGSPYITTTGIAHLYTEHYPAASVFGRARQWMDAAIPGSETATSADVLAALPHGDFGGASLLHFGCHGTTAVPVLGSSLDLGAGAKVAVRDILRQARAWHAEPNGSGGLVVLASCLTDVTEVDYDEALTLATAFLTAGAAGVVAARWRVADNATALFMVMFHHYLNARRASPVLALREAQSWMLDPAREVPDGLPSVLRDEAALADKPGGPDLTNPAAWAGFTYQGR